MKFQSRAIKPYSRRDCQTLITRARADPLVGVRKSALHVGAFPARRETSAFIRN